MLIIGSHVSYKGGLLYSVNEALNYNANTFMFYTGAPTNTIRSAINTMDTNNAWALMQSKGIDINNVICHAPYIINLASKANIEKYLFSINFLKEELNRCAKLGVTKIVVHPGNAVGISTEDGLNNIIEALNMILSVDIPVTILLETMAGKGSECGNTIDEIRTIIEGVNLKDKIGVCLDTCHLNDAGYNLINFDAFLDMFDKMIGIDKIKCVHINDSKNEMGAHKDRHENFGFGTIGFDTLLNIVYNERLENIPKILETPYVDDKAPYKYEIEMIRNKAFNSNLKEIIKESYEKE